MPEFVVAWQIALDALDEVDAARLALDTMRDWGSTAVVFSVQRVDAPVNARWTTVDLLTGEVSRPRTGEMDNIGTVDMDTVEDDDNGTG